MSWIENPTAHRGSPEARAEIDRLRAENKAQATEALRREVQRYAPQLLPQAVDRIVEREGQKLGGGDPARLATRVFEYLNSPAADHYRRPETVPVREQPAVDFRLDGAPVVGPASTSKPAAQKTDALRQALSLFAGDFKTPALMEKFYSEHALDYAHAEPTRAVEFVAAAMIDRKFRAFQKNEAEPSPATPKLAEALQPFSRMLKQRPLDLAEGELSDLAGPNATPSVKELSRWVEGRLKARPDLLIDGVYDASLAARPAPGDDQAELATARANFPDLFR